MKVKIGFNLCDYFLFHGWFHLQFLIFCHLFIFKGDNTSPTPKLFLSLSLVGHKCSPLKSGIWKWSMKVWPLGPNSRGRTKKLRAQRSTLHDSPLHYSFPPSHSFSFISSKEKGEGGRQEVHEREKTVLNSKIKSFFFFLGLHLSPFSSFVFLLKTKKKRKKENRKMETDGKENDREINL